MKLSQLFEASSKEFLLIHDSCRSRGGDLLYELIKKRVETGCCTTLLKLESSCTALDSFQSDKNLQVYTLQDPGGWRKTTTGSNEVIDDPVKFLHNHQNITKPDRKNVVVIDSLSIFLLYYPDLCYRTLHQLVTSHTLPGKPWLEVISLIHEDVVPGGRRVLTSFEQLATTNIKVTKRGCESLAAVEHRKPSGRLVLTTEKYFTDPNTGHMVTREVEEKKPVSSVDRDSQPEWMSNDVTFKLELEEEEKRARSQLVLPYLKTSEEQSGSGEITYEPDEGDDWDEEDPDDDLNI